MANNPAEILARFDQVQQQANSATSDTPESSQTTSPPAPNVAIDPQTIAAITNIVSGGDCVNSGFGKMYERWLMI